ncbi:MAG: tRNA pseudouridine(55) synthase TruB [Alphaproteobacteria bacterium TMED199]|jgi:tRNA pseudouridine55 synthase|nr:MAG: tRNA pseudouridine(55) synthase TruB [Alphaproteobacteria bacterium TMED199]
MIKKNSNKISGWIILDKKSGITSRQAISKISKIFKFNKIGHGGTLDPLATGVLPIAVGEATKLISFIQNKKKKYSFTIRWGEATDTDDSEGKIIKKSNSRPNKEEIQNALISFIGKIQQIPPNFSAIKIDGERSYNLARKNISVRHKPRQIEVHEFTLKKILNIDTAEFEVICGKGTYIRSLARDLAEKLNTKGHIIKLRRHFVGNFNEKDKIFIDFSEEIIHSPTFLEKIIPIEKVLDDIPALFLTKTEAMKLRQGQKIRLNSLNFKKNFIKEHPNYQEFETVYTVNDKKLVALIEIDDGLVKPKRIINY